MRVEFNGNYAVSSSKIIVLPSEGGREHQQQCSSPPGNTAILLRILPILSVGAVLDPRCVWS
jgi:hypothetical protein